MISDMPFTQAPGRTLKVEPPYGFLEITNSSIGHDIGASTFWIFLGGLGKCAKLWLQKEPPELAKLAWDSVL